MCNVQFSQRYLICQLRKKKLRDSEKDCRVTIFGDRGKPGDTFRT